ncbi:MAG: hypothetical protein GVY07_03155 [Bacteroidetes bacterium]|jgi:hypothetical protein|nr:hypothetical protein [Bacteroidota bacterium]
MKKLIFGTLLFIFPFTLSQNQALAQNSGERYVACTSQGCAIIGNEFCDFVYVLKEDGEVKTYWCVIWVVEGEPAPEEA